jgi:glycine betaine/proline transport system ATP-binding protein
LCSIASSATPSEKAASEVSAVVFEHVDILFGDKQAEALSLVDKGASRDDILKATGVVLGAADIELSIEPSEICVLMGLSGSGKSTILRAVNGLNTVARGKVLVRHGDGAIDVAHCGADELRMLRTSRIAMVFQQFALLPWRTVKENVAFGLELRRMPPAQIDKIVADKLAMVGLTQWASKFGHELSGGMQQRVGLARAFATDADILLMDEPFSALDPLIRDKLQDELLLLQKDLKKTIIFVSHDLDEALKIGNRIAILEGGRIVQWGTAEDILLRPADAYVAEFVKHMNPLNVLRGGALMTPAAALRRHEGEVLLDRAGRIRMRLDDEGRPVGVTLDGAAGILAQADGATGETSAREGFDIVVAPIDLRMRSAIALRRASGNPIVLVDQLGRMAGLCGDDEIYRALMQQRRAAEGA